MAAPVHTQEQLTDLVRQLVKRLVKLEKEVRSMIVDDDSGSFLSKVTSMTSGIGSVSGSWSAERSVSEPLVIQTSGTGSASLSIPELENLPGA